MFLLLLAQNQCSRPSTCSAKESPSIKSSYDVIKAFATPSASILPESVKDPIVGGAEALATLATGSVAP